MEPKRIIVIGGGLGGISAAVSLASEGYEVELFEKNDKLGGKLNVLEQDGFRFDLGPSIIIMPEVWRAVFAKAGERLEDHVELVPVEPQWRSIFPDGVITDLHGDRDAMNRELAKLGASRDEYWRFVDYSRRIYEAVRRHVNTFYDDGGSIGRRYRRQDEAGTPFGITIDGQSTQDQTVTVRDRDTLLQERVAADRLLEYLKGKIAW